MKDPYIRYRYASGAIVEAQCSSAHPRIASGAAVPLGEEDRAAYAAFLDENDLEVPEDVLVPVASDEDEAAESAGEAEETPVAELIPDEFPHAEDLNAAGIVTFDAIPEDPTTVKGIGRAGAKKIADALAARAVATTTTSAE